MNKLIKLGVKETAQKLGLEEKLVKQVINHYFSCLYLTVIRGTHDIKLMGYFTIKKTKLYESIRSKLNFRNFDNTRDSGD